MPTGTAQLQPAREKNIAILGPLIVHGWLETSAAAVQQRSMLDQQRSARHDILTFILLSMITEGREPVGILYLFPYHQSAKQTKELSRLA